MPTNSATPTQNLFVGDNSDRNRQEFFAFFIWFTIWGFMFVSWLRFKRFVLERFPITNTTLSQPRKYQDYCGYYNEIQIRPRIVAGTFY